MNAVETQNRFSQEPGAAFRRIKEIMSQPLPADIEMDFPAPWTDTEFYQFAHQEPLPPNQSFMLPAEEQPINDPNQLDLNYL